MSKQLNKTFRKIRLRPAQQIVLSFLVLIVAGTILLALPISQASNQANFLDHIFTATSAVCVTGLVTNVTVETYSIFGQSVIILLMQLGGLGPCKPALAGVYRGSPARWKHLTSHSAN